MKNLFIVSILLFAFLNCFAQTDFNLKNLNNISVEITDDHNYLSSQVHQKLITEIKIRLKAAGIKLSPNEEAEEVLNFNIRVIKSNFAEHRILIHMFLFEEAKVKRSNMEIPVISYYDYEFYADKMIEQSVYDRIMDVMIIRFLEKYMTQNS